MGEPTLWSAGLRRTSTLRLSLEGYKRFPLAIRVDRFADGSVSASGSRLVADGGDCPDYMHALERWFTTERARQSLAAEEWQELVALLSETGFEGEPGHEPPPPPSDDEVVSFTLHGVGYLLERRDLSGYHYVLRDADSSLSKKPAFQAFCRRMVELSGLEVSSERYCP